MIPVLAVGTAASEIVCRTALDKGSSGGVAAALEALCNKAAGLDQDGVQVARTTRDEVGINSVIIDLNVGRC